MAISRTRNLAQKVPSGPRREEAVPLARALGGLAEQSGRQVGCHPLVQLARVQ